MVVAAIAAGAAVASAGAQMIGSSQAAGAAKDAAGKQDAMYQRTRGDLQPFVTTGYNALQDAYGVARRGPTGGGPDFTSMAYENLPLRMTQAELEQTPGYQFTRDQGLKSVQSAAAARGLGVSGAALKGAAEYSTGLANKTYADQFNLAQQRFTDYINLNQAQQGNLKNEFDRYNTLATTGENAAAQTGTAGASAARAEGTFLNQAGQLQGSGMINATNALSGGLNNYLAYDAYRQRMGANPMTSYEPTGTNADTPLYTDYGRG